MMMACYVAEQSHGRTAPSQHGEAGAPKKTALCECGAVAHGSALETFKTEHHRNARFRIAMIMLDHISPVQSVVA
jgi:hypothetical protein